MKFSIRDLIVSGTLGGTHAGMERAEVRACLGEPDDWMEPNDGPRVLDRAPIWRYGNFEIHFFLDDSVSMLFLDYLAEPEAGKERELDPWFLGEVSEHSLDAVRIELQKREVDFDDVEDRRGAPVLRVKGGADLTFDNPEDEWVWGAIVVDAPSAGQAAGWDKVYTVHDWYDGPRRGVASFEGHPHLFESEFTDLDDVEDVFILSPLDADTFKLALEDWQIWRRWECAFHAKETPKETHPALPEDRRRWAELQRLLAKAGVVHPHKESDGSPQPAANPSRAVRAAAEFSPSGTDNGHASLRVKWRRL